MSEAQEGTSVCDSQKDDQATIAFCFDILAHVGSAKSYYLEAIELAKAGDFAAAEEKIVQGDDEFSAGHARHFEMLQKDVSGEQKASFSLILLHTEDQMASAETLKTVSVGLCDVYRRLGHQID